MGEPLLPALAQNARRYHLLSSSGQRYYGQSTFEYHAVRVPPPYSVAPSSSVANTTTSCGTSIALSATVPPPPSNTVPLSSPVLPSPLLESLPTVDAMAVSLTSTTNPSVSGSDSAAFLPMVAVARAHYTPIEQNTRRNISWKQPIFHHVPVNGIASIFHGSG